jgi:hypothetical protein
MSVGVMGKRETVFLNRVRSNSWIWKRKNKINDHISDNSAILQNPLQLIISYLRK